MSSFFRTVGLKALVGLLCAVLTVFALQTQAAECPQITSWSSQDTVFFPVQRVSRVERNNTPGLNYFDLLGKQEKSLHSTYFLMSAGPSLTKDQRFWNSLGVSLFSFASAADAKSLFDREYASFFQLNPVRWNYKVLYSEPQGTLVWYDDTPGAQEIQMLRPHKNTLISIVLRSASSTETLQDGLDELKTRLGRAYDLIDARCGGSGNIYAPSIYIEGDFGLSHQAGFQRRLAAGKLVIVATDQNGRSDLDWSTFRLFVAGIDKTGHALQTVQRLASAGRVTYSAPDDTPYLESYELHLDPSQLTGGHNFFNIAFNGEWPVQLRICDRTGLCGQTDYKLYFGPFLLLDSFIDHRCRQGDTSGQVKFMATWGNHGYSSVSNFYVVLSKSMAPWETWTGDYWSLSLDLVSTSGKLQWMHSSYGMQPVFWSAPIDLPTGTLVNSYEVVTSALAWNAGNRELLSGGSHSLVNGALDLSPGLGQGALWVQKAVVTMCNTP